MIGYHRTIRREGGGGYLAVGPLQVNWYNGLRVHLTWPKVRTLVITGRAR